MVKSFDRIMQDKDIEQGFIYLKYRLTSIKARLVLEMIVEQLNKGAKKWN